MPERTSRVTRHRSRSSSSRRFAALPAERPITLGPLEWPATGRPSRQRGADVSGEAAAVRAIPASQLARRERILDAAMELATEGGYDAVQMREVAERADVALGTLYRYFPSKVHLLVAAMGRTFQSLQESVRVDGSDGTPQERVYRVVAAVTRYLARH